MCDYSLMHVASRPVRQAEKLVTQQFPGTTSRGLASPADANTAVCVLPGTEMAFTNPVRLRSDRLLGSLLNIVKEAAGYAPGQYERVAKFVQINKHDDHTHHDALQFVDGNVVLLHHLQVGQEVTIVQLPADPSTLDGHARHEAEEAQRRAAFV